MKDKDEHATSKEGHRISGGNPKFKMFRPRLSRLEHHHPDSDPKGKWETFTITADDVVQSVLKQVSEIAEETLLNMSRRQMEQLVDSLLTKPAATPLIFRKAKMESQAIEAVMQSGRYLTSQQLAEIAGLSHMNPSAQPNKWKSSGRIFAVNYKGIDYYPDFGLDPEDNYRPFVGLKPILEVFSRRKSAWKIAFWFQSPNGTLNFRAPQDVLQEEPELVLAAAHDEVQGVQHG